MERGEGRSKGRGLQKWVKNTGTFYTIMMISITFIFCFSMLLTFLYILNKDFMIVNFFTMSVKTRNYNYIPKGEPNEGQSCAKQLFASPKKGPLLIGFVSKAPVLMLLGSPSKDRKQAEFFNFASPRKLTILNQ